MKTLRIFLGFFFSVACLIVLVLIDIDTVNTVVNFGGLVAYFEKKSICRCRFGFHYVF